MNLRNRRGQAALEGAFIILFVTVAAVVILQDVLVYNNSIIMMSEARLAGQGVALEMTLEGIKTDLIRVDGEPNTGEVLYPVFYMMSGSCSDAFNRLDSIWPGPGELVCSEELYEDAYVQNKDTFTLT